MDLYNLHQQVTSALGSRLATQFRLQEGKRKWPACPCYPTSFGGPEHPEVWQLEEEIGTPLDWIKLPGRHGEMCIACDCARGWNMMHCKQVKAPSTHTHKHARHSVWHSLITPEIVWYILSTVCMLSNDLMVSFFVLCGRPLFAIVFFVAPCVQS